MSARASVGSLPDAALAGKVVFERCDFNVPQDKATLAITDDTRIRAALPTIRHLVSKGAKVVLASHLGRPKGPAPATSLAPVAARLAELLGQPVALAPDCVGAEAKAMIAALAPGQVLLLENVRWHPEEEANDPAFAKELAAGCDVYVNDAFGTAHRAHASTAGAAAHLSPKVAGFLMQKELEYLDGAVAAPVRPFAAIVGGAKVSSKIGVIDALLQKCNKLVLGGGMSESSPRVGLIRVDSRRQNQQQILFQRSPRWPPNPNTPPPPPTCRQSSPSTRRRASPWAPPSSRTTSSSSPRS
jgi:phosphoglycerate kinase